MAKYVTLVKGSFDEVVSKIENGVLHGSITASLEDFWDVRSGDSRCSVRVFERFSYTGGNRVSMNVTVFQAGSDAIRVCAITSGGSQATFFKLNTIGEEAFLDTIKDIL